MFFIASRRIEGSHWDQLGIVVAPDIVAAAAKLGKEIDMEIPYSFTFCSLDRANPQEPEYMLEEYPELDSLPEIQDSMPLAWGG